MSFKRVSLGAQVLSFAPLSPTLSRKVKTACGLFYGRYGLPLPHPAQIVSVVGTPIPGARCQCMTQSAVMHVAELRMHDLITRR